MMSSNQSSAWRQNAASLARQRQNAENQSKAPSSRTKNPKSIPSATKKQPKKVKQETFDIKNLPLWFYIFVVICITFIICFFIYQVFSWQSICGVVSVVILFLVANFGLDMKQINTRKEVEILRLEFENEAEVRQIDYDFTIGNGYHHNFGGNTKFNQMEFNKSN